MLEDHKEKTSAEQVMYDLGIPVAHSSDPDGVPDVGISLGLGGSMLYVGDAPGVAHKGWSIVIYPKHGDLEVIGFVEDGKGEVLLNAVLEAIRSARHQKDWKFRPKITEEEAISLVWPMPPELRMDAAMCLWEAALDVWDMDFAAMSALNDHRDNVGTVQMRYDLMALVEPLHVGWHIHERAAGDDPLVPFDWSFVPWFLKTCAVVEDGTISVINGWEEACRKVRGKDHG